MLSKSKIIVICLFSTMILSIGFSAWSEEVDENTVLWFTFDEDFKGEVEDASGNGNNGTAGAGVQWLEEGKIGGGCAEFAGTGEITVPLVDISEAITLECFFQSEKIAQGTHRHLINRGWFANGTYLLWLDNEWADMCVSWSIETAVRKEVRPERVVKPGEWQYVAATYDGEKMKLYLDGEFVGETTQAGELVGGSVIIGGNGFIGLIDEVRISNIARDVSEIKAHMEGKGAAVNPNTSLSTTWGILKSK
jgi:hypothetical protein